MKQLATSLLPSLIQPNSLVGSTVVVIDVLRATSVIVTALSNGAERILACESIDEAHRLASANPTSTLLCGERGGVPIDGFNLGNSPAEYDREIVEGKTIVMTTTNGTRAIAAASAADELITASFLNLSAAIRHVRDCNRVLIVCAGTDGHVTREDVLAAGAIAKQLTEHHEFQSNDDSTSLALSAWQSATSGPSSANALAKQLASTTGGRNLQRLGYDADFDRVARMDRFDTVPRRAGKDPIELRLAVT